MDKVTYTHIEHEEEEPASNLVTLAYIVGTPVASAAVITIAVYFFKWIGGLI